jgi:XTP/dITP diphosphohydrolase
MSERKIIVATHNPGKLREISALLGPLGVETVSAGELGIAEPEETGDTFAANALLKARASAEASGLLALADDSGLEVEALDGRPGIYSARWGGAAKNFQMAMQKVNDELAKCGATTAEQRRANFTCALCLAWPDGHHEIFEGKVFGCVTWPPRGSAGFGYDPFFVPDGHEITFAEMEADRKHSMSHRAAAFAKLLKWWGEKTDS